MLMVDSGNFSDHPTPVGDVRTRALLEGMARIGYSAVNVGERDIRYGWEKFQERTRDSRVQFVSANIVDKETGRPVFSSHAVVEAKTADGQIKRRVGVIGVSRFNPIFSKPGPDGTTLAIAHPIEPVRQAVAQLQQEDVEIIVLLAAMHRDDSARLVRDVPGIDFVLGSYGGYFTQEPDREGDTVLIYAGNQGKQLGVTRLFLKPEPQAHDFVTKLHVLTDRYPDVPALLDFVNETYKEEDRIRAAERQTQIKPRELPGMTLPAGRYSGNMVCMKCHVDAGAQWASTAHAHALDSLEKDPQGGDVACRSCHVTGFGESDGFVDRKTTPHLASVGCETCHGPGRDHAARPARGYGKVSVRSCSTCHTTQQSPDFNYYTYLTKVSHQETKTAVQ